MSGYIQSNQMISITAPGAAGTYSVQAADSGKTILVPNLGAASPLTILLPTRQAGLKYRFMAEDTVTSIATITPTSNGVTPLNATVYGSLINLTIGGAVAAVNKSGNNTCQLLAAALVGDYIDFNCDGTFWYVNGLSRVVGFA